MLTEIDNIPAELKAVPQWVCWAAGDKIPRNAMTGGNAQSNNPQTWCDFATAVQGCEEYGFAGLGFMFAAPYFGVDLDHCLENKEFCDEFVETLGSYAEISKSGNGLHIICRGELPGGARRRGGVEMYSSGRYFICTGNLYNLKYTKVVDCTETIKILHHKFLPDQSLAGMERAETGLIPTMSLEDSEVLDKARNCKTGYLFAALYDGSWEGAYPSQSEADLALCNLLAFWCGRDKAQMDRIFRASGLYRPKWDRRQRGTTYGALTIGKACANCTEVYDPALHANATDLALAVFKNGSVSPKPKKVKAYDMNDTGNAHRLYDQFGTSVRYSYNRKKWYVWTGKNWRIDDTGEIKKLSDLICEDLKAEAFRETDEEKQEALLKWANRSASSRSKEAMIKETQHLGGIPASPDDFDAHPDLLNTQSGVINLRNGEILPHDASLGLTKVCYSECAPAGQRPERWLSFLSDITGGDAAMIRYIQKSIGYSLSGSGREQCAFFLYGMGNNGKSTFLDTVSDLLGSYAANTQPETIMLKKNGGGEPLTDIARLKSARFVTVEEPTEGIRLNEGLLKQLTGGSKITCRFLYGDEFEYVPEFKLWIATNHKPTIRGTDLGIWRRIRLIPFEVNIPQEKVDKLLKYKLRKEFPQILRWAVEGCMLWLQEGLDPPVRVAEAVKEYRQEMDVLATYMEQCVIIDYTCDQKLYAKTLFQSYRQWARENNEWEMSSKKFLMEMTKKLPAKGRDGKGTYFKNVRLTGDGAVYNPSDFH